MATRPAKPEPAPSGDPVYAISFGPVGMQLGSQKIKCSGPGELFVVRPPEARQFRATWQGKPHGPRNQFEIIDVTTYSELAAIRDAEAARLAQEREEAAKEAERAARDEQARVEARRALEHMVIGGVRGT